MPPAQAEKRSGAIQDTQTTPQSKNSPVDEAIPVRHQVHVILQNKGGIGKTIVAMNLIQFLRDERNLQVTAIDLDPMNHTLAEYAGLRAKSVDLFEDDGHADLKGGELDGLAQAMLTDAASFVIDNGAAGFVRFGGYLAESEFATMLADHGRDLVIHAVVAGGDMASQCILGLNTLLTSFPPAVRVVVWLNEHHGPVEIDGMGFQEMKIYRDNVMRFAGLVRLPRLSPLFLQDFAEMLRRRLTYAEAIGAPSFHIMNKQRLVMTRRAVWEQLDKVLA
jgi:hypothetical protein